MTEYQSRKTKVVLVSFIASCILALGVLTANFYLFRDSFFTTSSETNEAVPYFELYQENMDRILDNTGGNVPILEYHIVETPTVTTNLVLTGKVKKNRKTERFFVTTAELKGELETLYTNGFRNISLNEYLSLMRGKRKGLERIAPGSKLYCITFDDATYGQFDVTGTNSSGEPVIDPDSAVGVLLDMSRRHGDFLPNAAFCVDFENPPFTDEKYSAWKLNKLLDLGFEIVNHTRSHSKLSSYFPRYPNAAAFEIGSAMEQFRKYLGDRAERIDKICYPDGRSNPMVWNFVKRFSYNGNEYRFVCGFDAKGYQAKNPNDPNFNPYNIARIETSRFTFDTFVLKAPNVYTLPSLAEVVSNRPWLLTGSEIRLELIKID